MSIYVDDEAECSDTESEEEAENSERPEDREFVVADDELEEEVLREVEPPEREAGPPEYVVQAMEEGEKEQVREFRLNCKSVFLTYAWLDLSKQNFESRNAKTGVVEQRYVRKRKAETPQEACDRIREEGGFLWAVLAQERSREHVHVHVFGRLKKKISTRNCHVFDSLFDVHGNYQSLRSASAALQYLLKDEGTVLVKSGDIDLEFLRQGVESVYEICVHLVRSGVSLRVVAQRYPVCVCRNFQALEKFAQYCENQRRYDALSELVVEDIKLVWDEDGEEDMEREFRRASLEDVRRKVEEWTRNVVQYAMRTRSERETAVELQRWMLENVRNLLLVGETGCGKSKFTDMLGRLLMRCDMVLEADNFDTYMPEAEFMVLQDYRGEYRISTLLRLTDIGEMTFKCRYAHKVRRRYIPCVLTSNETPREWYRKALQENPFAERSIRALERRLEIVDLKNVEFAKLHFLVKFETKEVWQHCY